MQSKNYQISIHDINKFVENLISLLNDCNYDGNTGIIDYINNIINIDICSVLYELTCNLLYMNYDNSLDHQGKLLVISKNIDKIDLKIKDLLYFINFYSIPIDNFINHIEQSKKDKLDKELFNFKVIKQTGFQAKFIKIF